MIVQLCDGHCGENEAKFDVVIFGNYGEIVDRTHLCETCIFLLRVVADAEKQGPILQLKGAKE